LEDIPIPKVLDYRPIGKGRPGQPLKRLLDGYNREAEEGHLLAQLRDQKKKKYIFCHTSVPPTLKVLTTWHKSLQSTVNF